MAIPQAVLAWGFMTGAFAFGGLLLRHVRIGGAAGSKVFARHVPASWGKVIAVVALSVWLAAAMWPKSADEARAIQQSVEVDMPRS